MNVLQIIGTIAHGSIKTEGQVVSAEPGWAEFLSREPDLGLDDLAAVQFEEQPDLIAARDDEHVVEDETGGLPPMSVSSPIPGISVQEHATTSDNTLIPDSELSLENAQRIPMKSELTTRTQPVIVGPVSEFVFAAPSEVEPSLGNVGRRTQRSAESTRDQLQTDDINNGPSHVKPLASSQDGEGRLEIPALETSLQTGSSIEPKPFAATEVIAPVVKAILPVEYINSKDISQSFPGAITRPQSVISNAAGTETYHSSDKRVLSVLDASQQVLLTESSSSLINDTPSKIGDAPLRLNGVNATLPTPILSSINAPSVKEQPILFQVSKAIESAEADTVELRLDPAELGKVRITMSARDGLMLATITAERPETLELLRRNSDSLDLTFHDQGFGETELDFQEFDDDDQGSGADEHRSQSDAVEGAEKAASRVVLKNTSDGLDIKL